LVKKLKQTVRKLGVLDEDLEVNVTFRRRQQAKQPTLI